MSDQIEEMTEGAETESQEAQAIPHVADDVADDGGDEAAEGELEQGVTDRQSRQARRDERWRDRARAAEERAERLARREVLRLLGERVTDPDAALTLSGADLADLLDDEGDVDGEAVAELAGRVTESRPYLRPTTHHLDLGPRGTSPSQGRKATWDGLIRRK